MSQFFRILSIIIVLTSCLHAQELGAGELKTLVEKLQQHRAQFPALNADFTEEKTTHLLTKPVSSTGTLSFEAPNHFRRDLKGKSPSLTVCNGSELWIYYPNFKQAEHYTLGEKQFFDDSLAALTAGLNFQGVDKFFRVTAMKDGDGHMLKLTPKSGSLKRILTTLSVWVNAEGIILKTNAELPKGDRLVTTYRNVRAAKQSDAKFEFTPPTDAQVSTPLGK
jgi:chaperone LolA